MVTYKKFLQDVKSLEFVTNNEMADSAVKAILGIVASSLQEEQAIRLAENLPEPLTFEKLRSHQKRAIAPTLKEFVSEISAQFRLDYNQAHELVDTVFHTTKEVVGLNVISDIEEDLPSDVAEEIERV